jgi:hypothetical protein
MEALTALDEYGQQPGLAVSDESRPPLGYPTPA